MVKVFDKSTNTMVTGYLIKEHSSYVLLKEGGEKIHINENDICEQINNHYKIPLFLNDIVTDSNDNIYKVVYDNYKLKYLFEKKYLSISESRKLFTLDEIYPIKIIGNAILENHKKEGKKDDK